MTSRSRFINDNDVYFTFYLNHNKQGRRFKKNLLDFCKWIEQEKRRVNDRRTKTNLKLIRNRLLKEAKQDQPDDYKMGYVDGCLDLYNGIIKHITEGDEKK